MKILDQSIGLSSNEASEFIILREAWEERILTFNEARRLQDIEDHLEEKVPDFIRVTPRRRQK